MKILYFTALMFLLSSVSAHSILNNLSIKRPDKLVCNIKGSVSFSNDSLDLYKDEEYTMTVSFKKMKTFYSDADLTEDLTEISKYIYSFVGVNQENDKPKTYSGTFVFNADFTLATYSENAGFTAFYKCEARKR